jgi:hypothetical protein
LISPFNTTLNAFKVAQCTSLDPKQLQSGGRGGRRRWFFHHALDSSSGDGSQAQNAPAASVLGPEQVVGGGGFFFKAIARRRLGANVPQNNVRYGAGVEEALSLSLSHCLFLKARLLLSLTLRCWSPSVKIGYFKSELAAPKRFGSVAKLSFTKGI